MLCVYVTRNTVLLKKLPTFYIIGYCKFIIPFLLLQGALITQQSYQQHNSGQGSQSFSGARATSTLDSAQHHFDIVPSISFSYQLDQETKNDKAPHMSY
jgi:hypothetical protein